MARLTIIIGAILALLGIAGFLLSGMASATALIPSLLGALLVVSGVVGIKRPKIGVHIALVIAVLGVAGTLMNVLQLGAVFAGTAERPVAVIVSTITFVLLIGYIVAGVRSFIAARRSRQAA